MDLLIALGTVVIVGTVARRLLGIPMAWPRTALAGVAGLLAFGTSAALMVGAGRPAPLQVAAMGVAALLAHEEGHRPVAEAFASVLHASGEQLRQSVRKG